ncbi:MAG: prolipoprotein diacylglyceryl transferase [Candidatus Aenigmatarchaeota archaeon]
MKPVLFYLGEFPVYSYTFFILIGLFIAVPGVIIRRKQENLTLFDCIYLGMLCFISGVIFAKIFSFISQFPYSISKFTSILLFFRKGFSFHGALVGVFLAIFYFSKETKRDFLKILDLIAPFGCLSYAIGRFGCYFNGCCYGIKTNSILSVNFINSPYIQDKLSSYHPVQLYDSYLSFLLFLFLLEYKKKFKGEIFLLFLLGNSLIRFFVEYFRWGVSAKVVAGFITQAQIASIVIIIISIYLIKRKKGEKNEIFKDS